VGCFCIQTDFYYDHRKSGVAAQPGWKTDCDHEVAGSTPGRGTAAQSPVHTSNNVEATGNIVEATFDFVEATFDFVATNGNNVERLS